MITTTESTEKQGRGVLTARIKEASKRLMGYEMTVRELRLMPHIQHTMVNTQKIDPQKCNGEERVILQKWRDAGYIEGGASGLQITKEFWSIINEIIYLGYVDLG